MFLFLVVSHVICCTVHMPKKRKHNSNSLSNLKRGQQRSEKQSKPSPTPKTKNAFTTMHGFYTRQNPSPAIKAAIDELHYKVISRYDDLSTARNRYKPRSHSENIMLIQFVLDFL